MRVLVMAYNQAFPILARRLPVYPTSPASFRKSNPAAAEQLLPLVYEENRRRRDGSRLHGRANRAGPAKGRSQGHQAGYGQPHARPLLGHKEFLVRPKRPPRNEVGVHRRAIDHERLLQQDHLYHS